MKHRACWILVLAFAFLLWPRSAHAVFDPPKTTNVMSGTPCVVGIPPVCEPLAVDGSIGDLEYVDSAQAPMQDWGGGNPTGMLWLQQSKQEKLNFALRLHPGNMACGAVDDCGFWYTVIYFDARRKQTLDKTPAAWTIGEDDRAIVITHYSMTSFATTFWRGSPTVPGTWIGATGGERWPAEVQIGQLYELRKFIDQKAQPPDRPAFVLGDSNSNARTANQGLASNYGQMLGQLGLLTLTPFDAATSLFSKRYDIGLGCKDNFTYTVPPVKPSSNPSLGCNPLLTTEVFSYAAAMTDAGSDWWKRLGVGTDIGDKSYCDAALYGHDGDVNTPRIDHILVIPPEPPSGVLPVFAIAKDPEEPYVVVDTFPDPGQQGVGADCFSDHKAVFGVIDLVRREEKLAFNPKMRHEIAHVVQRLENFAGDAAGGAEFYSYHGYTDALGVFHKNNHGVYEEDQDVINPGWTSTTPADNGQVVYFGFDLRSEDLVSDDKYDVTAWGGREIWSAFFHTNSLWNLTDSTGQPQQQWCFDEIDSTCFGKSVHTMSMSVKGMGASGDIASILHGLVAKEAP